MKPIDLEPIIKKVESLFNQDKPKEEWCSLIFHVGIKPDDYFMSADLIPKVRMIKEALFCEIFHNDKCLFRECVVFNKDMTIGEAMEKCMERLLISITAQGINAVIERNKTLNFAN